MKFTACGHKNITATHKTTLEFTKDAEVTQQGDCIVGVKADFSFEEIKACVERAGSSQVTLTITWPDGVEQVSGFVNKQCSDPCELVIRKSDFISERTLMIRADKAASDLNRSLVEFLAKGEHSKITVSLVVS